MKYLSIKLTKREIEVILRALEEQEKDLFSDLQEYDSNSPEAAEITAEAQQTSNLISRLNEL